MRRALTLASIAAAGVLAPALAAAQHYGYATRNVNVRAGPDRSYPLVGWLQEGAPVEIFGCLDTWHWCDIQGGAYRGWVYSGFLAAPYQGGWATIVEVGPDSGLPVVGFALDAYWDSYYVTWPWYGELPVWVSRPPIHHRPWRPPQRPPIARPPPPGGVVVPGRPPTVLPPVAKPPGGKPPAVVPLPRTPVAPETRPRPARPPNEAPPAVPQPAIGPAGSTPFPSEGQAPSINPQGPTPFPSAGEAPSINPQGPTPFPSAGQAPSINPQGPTPFPSAGPATRAKPGRP